MDNTQSVLEYNCPCCGAGLKFGENIQKMTCEYCDNTFDLETVKTYNNAEQKTEDSFEWDPSNTNAWTNEETNCIRSYTCQSCGGELITDENTVATFCPYCENPTILPGRVSGTLRPDAVIPFQKSKEEAKAAFTQLCKGKPLLPKMYSQEQRIERITGIYVPFWLYNCSTDFDATYKATRVRHWMDSKYSYTKTDHYLLTRAANADFSFIPMDASSKMDNAIMESIEPFDFSKMIDFETAYLSGFFADRYDVESTQGEERIRQRVSETMEDMIGSSLIGYSSAIPTSKQIRVLHGSAKYVLLPVWMLHTKYKNKTYVFAMNGQTGKMTGTFPICPKRSAAWFAGICLGVTAIVSLLTMLPL
jgi:DNA-directed RNA polymerase subunit RPC12/RpoP